MSSTSAGASAHSYWAKMTPDQRRAEMKRRAKVRKWNEKRKKQQAHPKKKEPTHAKASASREAEAIAYLFGKVETIIEYYAHSNGLSFSALADGVASLFRHKAGR